MGGGWPVGGELEEAGRAEGVGEEEEDGGDFNFYLLYKFVNSSLSLFHFIHPYLII